MEGLKDKENITARKFSLHGIYTQVSEEKLIFLRKLFLNSAKLKSLGGNEFFSGPWNGQKWGSESKRERKREREFIILVMREIFKNHVFQEFSRIFWKHATYVIPEHRFNRKNQDLSTGTFSIYSVNNIGIVFYRPLMTIIVLFLYWQCVLTLARHMAMMLSTIFIPYHTTEDLLGRTVSATFVNIENIITIISIVLWYRYVSPYYVRIIIL